MKHKILAQFTGIFTFLILSICNVHAQFSVKGTLVDSLTHESEPYATIRITLDKSPEKPVRMNVTDAKGKFQEKVTANRELYPANHFGRKTYSGPPF
mgnify:CR=1 FL=1